MQKTNDVEMIPVSSSYIGEVGYDEENQILYVRFLNGSLYIYKEVPDYEFDDLLNASSKGQFLHYNIKYEYEYERLE